MHLLNAENATNQSVNAKVHLTGEKDSGKRFFFQSCRGKKHWSEKIIVDLTFIPKGLEHSSFVKPMMTSFLDAE